MQGNVTFPAFRCFGYSNNNKLIYCLCKQGKRCRISRTRVQLGLAKSCNATLKYHTQLLLLEAAMDDMSSLQCSHKLVNLIHSCPRSLLQVAKHHAPLPMKGQMELPKLTQLKLTWLI